MLRAALGTEGGVGSEPAGEVVAPWGAPDGRPRRVDARTASHRGPARSGNSGSALDVRSLSLWHSIELLAGSCRVAYWGLSSAGE